MPPFIPSPLGGFLGVHTATFYRLNPLGIPVLLISDLNPIPSADRIKLDMIDSESAPRVYTTTIHPMQDFTSATTNIHKEPTTVEVTGTLISSINLGLIGSVGLGALPGVSSALRPDLIAIQNLETLADRREIIMYVSPRVSLPKAFITSITPIWDPTLGENTMVTIGLIEARIVDPLSATSAVLDVANSLTGNNAAVPAGAQSGAPVSTQAVNNSPVQGVAPSISVAP